MSGARAISIIALAAALIFLFTLGVAMVAESAIEAPSHEILLNFNHARNIPIQDAEQQAPRDGVTVEKPSFKGPPEIRR